MSQQISPWLEGAYGWSFGEGGWNSGMDTNLLKFSFLFDRNVDSIVASLPSAVNGQAHYLTTDNRLYFVVGTTYFSTVVPKWFTIVVRATGVTWQYNGTALIEVESTADLDTRLGAVELTIASLGTAAFEDISAFATAGGLDIVEANAQAYTDVLRQDLANDVDPAKGAGQIGFDQALSYGAGTIGAAIAGLLTSTSDIAFPDQFADLATWAASGGNLGIVAGTYPVTEQLSFPFGTVVHCFGEVTLDASAVVSDVAFPDLTVVKAGGGSLTALPDIATSSAGGLSTTFNTDHGLVEGDVFIIYNPTDNSYSSHRAEYRSGEFRKVSVVTSTTVVRCDAPQYVGYTDTTVDVYKLNGGSFSISGSLVIKGSSTLTNLRAFRGHRLIDADISGVKAICPIGPAAIELFQCFNVSGAGVCGVQNQLSGTGTDYGLVIANCQRVRIDGQFTASRHGVTCGGFNEAGCVVNRDISISGIMATNFLGGVPAANTHGNSEFVTFSGKMVGCSLGGNFITVRGNVSGASNGLAIEMVEMTGYSRDLRGVSVKSIGNPNAIGRGVIDVGGNSEPAAPDTIGGVIDCSGMVVDAPVTQRVFMFRQRNAVAADMRIKLNGAEVLSAAVGAISVLVGTVTGSNFATLDRAGFIDHTAGTDSVAGVNEVIGATARGVGSGTTSTSAAFMDIAITFPVGRFIVDPVLKVSVNKVLNGAKGVVAAAISISTAGATIRVATIDNTNFAAAVLTNVAWEANSIR